jgi:hypothetical protein
MAMNGKNVLILGCSPKQLEYAQYLQSECRRLIIVDKSPFIQIQFDAIHIKLGYDKVGEITSALSELGIMPDIIFTAADQISHIYACELAQELGITYRLSKDLAETINTKFRYYDMFSNHGLDIPLTAYYYDKESLSSALREQINSGQIVYVKSDYSKNPRYVYKIENISQVEHINWVRDRHLNQGYVVQPFVVGTCYRLNLFNSQCVAFNFDTGQILSEIPSGLRNYLPKLYQFNFLHGLDFEIVKFDLIYHETNGVRVLDIGLDPPSRLREYCLQKQFGFVEAYCKLRTGNPDKMNAMFEDVIQSSH